MHQVFFYAHKNLGKIMFLPIMEEWLSQILPPIDAHFDKKAQ